MRLIGTVLERGGDGTRRGDDEAGSWWVLDAATSTEEEIIFGGEHESSSQFTSSPPPLRTTSQTSAFSAPSKTTPLNTFPRSWTPAALLRRRTLFKITETTSNCFPPSCQDQQHNFHPLHTHGVEHNVNPRHHTTDLVHNTPQDSHSPLLLCNYFPFPFRTISLYILTPSSLAPPLPPVPKSTS